MRSEPGRRSRRAALVRLDHRHGIERRCLPDIWSAPADDLWRVGRSMDWRACGATVAGECCGAALESGNVAASLIRQLTSKQPLATTSVSTTKKRPVRACKLILWAKQTGIKTKRFDVSQPGVEIGIRFQEGPHRFRGNIATTRERDVRMPRAKSGSRPAASAASCTRLCS